MDVTWTTLLLILGGITDCLALAGYFSTQEDGPLRLLNEIPKKVWGFVFFSVTWVMLVICWYLIFEPYGAYPTDSETNQLVGIMLAGPCLLAFKYALKLIGNDEEQK